MLFWKERERVDDVCGTKGGIAYANWMVVDTHQIVADAATQINGRLS
jgi:hypothetical protein